MVNQRWIVVLAGLLVAAPTGVEAAPRPAEIVLEGTAVASTTVSFAKPVTIHNGVPLLGQRGASISSAGDLGGFVLDDEDGTDPAFAVAAVEDEGFASERYVVGGRTVTLRPGRYRLTLIADGPTKVRIPVDGLPRTVTLRPKTSTPVARHVLDLRTGGAAPAGANRAPATISSRTFGLFAVRVRGSGSALVFGVDVCLVGNGRYCYGDGRLPSNAGFLVGASSAGLAYWYHSLPGETAAGAYDVVWYAGITGYPAMADGYALLVG